MEKIISWVLSYISSNFLEGSIVASLGMYAAFKAYKIVKHMFNPVQYIAELYELADKIIINIDNRIIDKFLKSSLKEEVQLDLRNVLIERKKKIDSLIETISD